MVDFLLDEGVEGDIWLDGSFITEKINPRDIDFILVLKSKFYDEASARQRDAVEVLLDGKLWEMPFLCDTNYVMVEEVAQEPQNAGEATAEAETKERPPRPPETGLSWDGPNDGPLGYWHRRFGFSVNSRTPKGIVIIRLERRNANEQDSTASAAIARS